LIWALRGFAFRARLGVAFAVQETLLSAWVRTTFAAEFRQTDRASELLV